MLKLAYPIGTPDTRGKLAAYRGDTDEVLEALKAIGYSAIEPFVRDPSAMDTKHFCRAVQQHGFEVAAVGTGPIVGEDKLTFGSQDESVRKAAIERTKAVIDFAALFGAQVIVGKLRGDIHPADPEKSRELMKRAFRDVCKYAAARQVEITIEPQNRFVTNNLNTTQQAVALIRELGFPNLFVMCDVFHMNIEETSIAASLIGAKDYIRHIHFAENNRGVPGSGHLDFHEIVSVLKALHYDRYISVEIDQLPDAHHAAKASFDFLHPLVSSRV